MTETSNTSRLSPTDVGFQAFAQHVATYELPAPFMVISPSSSSDAINVHITKPEHLTLWLDSVVVDDEHRETRRDHEHVVYQTRLPDHGVRVDIRTVESIPSPRRLQAVSG